MQSRLSKHQIEALLSIRAHRRPEFYIPPVTYNSLWLRGLTTKSDPGAELTSAGCDELRERGYRDPLPAPSPEPDHSEDDTQPVEPEPEIITIDVPDPVPMRITYPDGTPFIRHGFPLPEKPEPMPQFPPYESPKPSGSQQEHDSYTAAYDNDLYRNLTARFDFLTHDTPDAKNQAAIWLQDACFERLAYQRDNVAPSNFGTDSEFRLRLWVVRNMGTPEREETLRLIEAYLTRFKLLNAWDFLWEHVDTELSGYSITDKGRQALQVR